MKKYLSIFALTFGLMTCVAPTVATQSDDDLNLFTIPSKKVTQVAHSVYSSVKKNIPSILKKLTGLRNVSVPQFVKVNTMAAVEVAGLPMLAYVRNNPNCVEDFMGWKLPFGLSLTKGLVYPWALYSGCYLANLACRTIKKTWSDLEEQETKNVQTTNKKQHGNK